MREKAERKWLQKKSCGHNASIAGMIGAGMGLVDSGVMKELDGVVSLMAVPAEELVELDYRNKLRQGKKLVFLAGKQEFIRLGLLDSVDWGNPDLVELECMDRANAVKIELKRTKE